MLNNTHFNVRHSHTWHSPTQQYNYEDINGSSNFNEEDVIRQCPCLQNLDEEGPMIMMS